MKVEKISNEEHKQFKVHISLDLMTALYMRIRSISTDT